MPDLTIAEAAIELGLAKSTVRDMVTARKIPHHRYGGRCGVRFTAEDLAAFRAATAEPVAPPVPARRVAPVVALRPVEASPDKPGPHTPPPPRDPAKLPRPTTPPKTDPPKKTRAA